MSRATLDENERAGLLALREVDPDGEMWVTPWASGMDLRKHGADALGSTLDGSIAVFRRLAQRNLVDGEPGVRGRMRGYSLNAKGPRGRGFLGLGGRLPLPRLLVRGRARQLLLGWRGPTRP